MVNSNPDLVTAITSEIHRTGGRIPFVRFMELALYHPQHGYYMGRRTRIGKEGDYYTSVSVSNLFGRILAQEFLRLRSELGEPAEFEVVELGGHRGQLADDVRAAARDLNYRVIEAGDPFPVCMVGCVFSNEFFDALPVHRVQVKKGAWHEIYVNDTFAEELGPLSDPRLEKSLGDLPVHLMEGYRTEINLRALDWLKRIAGSLERGYVLTFDYGYERDQYFAPEHRDGTLLCYRRHTKNDNPYQCVGEQDITAHVDFTQLMEHGASLNLETVRFTDQSHYLLEIGEPIIRQIVEQTAGQLSAERQAIHQLIHPELMGRTFKVLLQRKGAATNEHWRSDPGSVMLPK